MHVTKFMWLTEEKCINQNKHAFGSCVLNIMIIFKQWESTSMHLCCHIHSVEKNKSSSYGKLSKFDNCRKQKMLLASYQKTLDYCINNLNEFW